MKKQKIKLFLKKIIGVFGLICSCFALVACPIDNKTLKANTIPNITDSKLIKIKFTNVISSDVFSIDINFLSNGVSYTQMSANGKMQLLYNSTIAFNGDEWNNTAYQIIEIDSTQSNFQTFITAMKSNIEGVELVIGIYKWVEEPTTSAISFVAPFTFFTTGSYNYIKISVDTSHIVYTDFNYDTTNAYTFSNKDWWNNTYKTITTIENQYVPYDFYNYAILGNQLVKQSVTTTYPITGNITNGVLGGDTTIEENGTAVCTLVANSGYTLPTSISVVNATYNYIVSSGTATISLSNPTGDVYVTAVCPIAPPVTATIYKGRYIFNGILIINDDLEQEITFTSNGFEFNKIYTNSTDKTMSFNSSTNLVYNSGTWSNSNYKTVEVSANTTVSGTFNVWWSNNTTYVNVDSPAIISEGIYTFKDNADFYTDSFSVTTPFKVWNGNAFSSYNYDSLIVNNGLSYSKNGLDEVIYYGDTWYSKTSRCIKIESSYLTTIQIKEWFLNLVDSGNTIGMFVNGSYTFTTSSFGNYEKTYNIAFTYYNEFNYSSPQFASKIIVRNGSIYYVDYSNNETQVFSENGKWFDDSNRYILFNAQFVSSDIYTFLTDYGVFKNLYGGDTINTWQQFFFALADVPIYTFSRILNFDFFGISMYSAIFGVITALLCILILVNVTKMILK